MKSLELLLSLEPLVVNAAIFFVHLQSKALLHFDGGATDAARLRRNTWLSGIRVSNGPRTTDCPGGPERIGGKASVLERVSFGILGVGVEACGGDSPTSLRRTIFSRREVSTVIGSALASTIRRRS